MKRKYTHAIIYIGAPYGDDESGHIVSRHTSIENAEKAYDRHYSGTTGVYNHVIRELDDNGDWNR